MADAVGDGLEDDQPPSRWQGALAILAEAVVLVAGVIALSDVLWLGQRLLPWAGVVVLVLAGLLLVLRRHRGLATACLAGMLAASWPAVRAGFDPAAERLPADAAGAFSVVVVDGSAFDGDPAAARAALVATGADLIAVRCATGSALHAALLDTPDYAYERAELLRSGEGEARRTVGSLVVVARQRPLETTVHLAAGSDGLLLELVYPLAPDRVQRVLVGDFGPDDHPRRAVRQVPMIVRLGEIAGADGSLIVALPAAWDRAAPRWRAIAAASGTALPGRGLPSAHPRWLIRPFATADSVIAVRDLALRAEGVRIPGNPHRGVLATFGSSH